MRLRVLSVFGTRPEAIKMAPVVRAIAQRPNEFESLICLTAQHRDMLDQIMQAFDLRADFDLDLMQQGQSPAEVASRVLSALPAIFRQAAPNLILVQGDTTTTAATALAAFLDRIPVGHVEAGLRTGDLLRPFPEEMNRRMTTLAASLHFAPTERAREALLREGIADDSIFVTGNTVIDALLQSIGRDRLFDDDALNKLDSARRMVLVTLHRRESFGEPMRAVCNALVAIAHAHPDLQFVLPVHRNPMVREVVIPALSAESQFVLTEPLGYLDFVHLMARAHLIVTDSGGVQEEAPALDRPVLVVREVTERPEGVEAGASRLVGTDAATIIRNVEELLRDPRAYRAMASAQNPYGDGKAAGRIVAAIRAWANAAATPAGSPRSSRAESTP